MSTDQTTPAKRDVQSPDTLPYEPASAAELLSATHLFTVELDTLVAAEWARGEDELEHRPLRLRFRVLDVFKGAVAIAVGGVFDLEVAQHREDALTTSDYHGFWSHRELQRGARYLVLACAAGSDPRVIMQEPAIRALTDAVAAADVTAAIAAEKRYGSVLTAEADSARRSALARQLLRIAYEERSIRRGPFGRYVWARVAPVYPSAEDDLLSAVFEIVRSDDATSELREALIYGVYDAVLVLGPTPQRSLKVLRPLFGLLLQPRAAPLFDRLLQVPIYNLLFRPETAPPAVEIVIPNAGDRDRVKAVVAGFSSPRALEIGAWLAGR